MHSRHSVKVKWFPSRCSTCATVQDGNPTAAKLAEKWISIKWTPFSHSLLLVGKGHVLPGKLPGGARPWTYWLSRAMRIPEELCGSFVVQNLLVLPLDYRNFSQCGALLTRNLSFCPTPWFCWQTMKPRRIMQYWLLAEGGSIHIGKNKMWTGLLELWEYWPF